MNLSRRETLGLMTAAPLSMDSDWKPVDSMPMSVWGETRREGENGYTVSCWRPDSDPDSWDGGREYIDRAGYSTLINPGSFAEPTHWRPITKP